MRLGMNLIIRSLPHTEQEELGAFAMKYSGKKRARYMDAKDAVIRNGLDRRDSGISMFIKAEKIYMSKVNPDPRAIQFRDAKYCVVIASYLKPIEEHLYRVVVDHKLLSGTRIVGKGLNQVERACLVRRKMKRFKRCVVLSLDAARFDQHVDHEQLKEEHRVYTSCNSDPYFAHLLSWQLVNKCKSRLGYKYVTWGKRMSGDMNTALGNCILMLGMVLGIMVPLGKMFDILDDGDDCLLFIEEEDLEAVLAHLPGAFLEMGHEIKIENIAHSLEDINWCQSKPVVTKRGVKFVRDPFKVMSGTLVGVRWRNVPERVRLEFLAGLAECELMLNLGVPVLQEYALALARNSNGAKARFDDTSGEWFRYLRESRLYRKAESGVLTDEITQDARLSFARAFGIDTPTQIAWERKLRNWNFKLSSTTFLPQELDPSDWYNYRPRLEFQ